MKKKNAAIIAVVVPIVAVALAGIIILAVIGFNLFWSRPDDSFPYDAALANGYTGSEAEYVAGQDTPSTRERQLYEEAVQNGEFSGTYLEFLRQFEKSDDSQAVAEASKSVVLLGNAGAGVIYSIDESGTAYIVTAYRSDRTISVTFSDGTQAEAQYSIQDSYDARRYDLAVFRVSPSPSARAAKIADSDSIAVGERVYAIGNSNTNPVSGDKELSVTDGVVSVKEEYLSRSIPEIRIDAQIDSGKYGGGVFNARGELAGIVNTSREYSDNKHEIPLYGFGYAIPSNFVCKILGIGNQAVTAPEADESNVIAGVLANSVVCIEAYTNTFTGTYNSMGAGVIYSLDDAGTAYIITNYHVVHSKYGKASSISVYLYGSEESIPATFYGGVMSYDIAVLKVTNSEFLKESSACAVKIADSDSVTLGERVYALGNPNGEGFSATAGVVSVTEEYVRVARADEKIDITVPEIRTDAAVNHGNSGGGLFNAKGELVGIVNARRETGDNGITLLYGFGYAIPINFARSIADNVIANNGNALVANVVEKVSVSDSKGVYDEKTSKYYIEEKLVVNIQGSAAGSEAGLKRNDTLLSATLVRGGEKKTVQLTRQIKYSTLLFEIREGDTLTITYSRNGNDTPLTATVTFGKNDFKTIV